MKIGFGMQDPESSSAAVPEAEKDLPPTSVFAVPAGKGPDLFTSLSAF